MQTPQIAFALSWWRAHLENRWDRAARRYHKLIDAGAPRAALEAAFFDCLEIGEARQRLEQEWRAGWPPSLIS